MPYDERRIHMMISIHWVIFLNAALMGLFEKRRFRKLLMFVQDFDINDPKTWGELDPKMSTATKLFEKFGVDNNTQDFTGHALALYLNEQ